MTQPPELESKNPFHRANSLVELLCFNDIDFVRCAYVTMLGRQPDLPGQTHFVQQIRTGSSKLDLLMRLRQSTEGKQHDPGIAGLDRALKRAALQRRPLLGAISRFLRSDADGSSRSDRSMRILINATFVDQRYLQTIAERVGASSSFPALQALPSFETMPVQAQVDRFPQSDSTRLEQARYARTSPELDHLRRRKTNIGRLIKEEAL